MKFAFLLSLGLTVSLQVGGLRIERRDANRGGTISDEERGLRAARQYRPGAGKRNIPDGVLRARQGGPSATPCPAGSQRVDAICVTCFDLGRADNTAPGQACGACIDPEQDIGDDELCRDAPCADPNAEPLPEGGCGPCLDGYARLPGSDTCVLLCADPNATQLPAGGCGACSAGFVQVDGGGVCVVECDDANAEQSPNGGCGECVAGHGRLPGYDTCILLCNDPNAAQSPEGGCGACTAGHTRVDDTGACVLLCDDPNATQSPAGGCGACDSGYTRIDDAGVCVVACTDPNAEQAPEGGCGPCEGGYARVEGGEECVAVCNDPHASQSPVGGCGVCHDGYTRPVGEAECDSCASLELPEGTGGQCGAPCIPPLVYNPTTSACSCGINTTGSVCATCSLLFRQDTGEYGECGPCIEGYIQVGGQCVLLGLVNGGFEIGASSFDAPPWVRSGSTALNQFTDQASSSLQCHSGPGSRCWLAAGSQGLFNTVSQTVQLLSGRVYVLSFWVASHDSSAQGDWDQVLQVRIRSSTSTFLLQATVTQVAQGSTRDNWTQLSYLFGTGLTGVATLEFTGSGGGVAGLAFVLVDDVSITLYTG